MAKPSDRTAQAVPAVIVIIAVVLPLLARLIVHLAGLTRPGEAAWRKPG
jgi:hypothetical protein